MTAPNANAPYPWSGSRGPAPRFDPDTTRRRKNELTRRGQLVPVEIASYLATHHPKIFEKARAHAEAVISARGPLPGDDE